MSIGSLVKMAAYWYRVPVLLICLLHSCLPNANAVRTKDKIYIDMVTQNGCFRLMNATHQIGCSSAQVGNTGVVYYMQTQADWNLVLKDGTAAPYIPVLETVDFTSDNVRRLAKSGRVNGIAVISVNATSELYPTGFSADKSCPNDAYGRYHGTEQADCSQGKWNPVGEGLLFEDLNIPIFSLTYQSDVNTILKKCWEPFNKPILGVPRTYPLCAVQLVSAMTAAKDTETCIRRSNLMTNLNPIVFCDPLGDQNVLTTLKALPSYDTRPPNSVIVVATRMDSMSMFYNEYPSADSTVTGIVTLLATAGALWRLQDTLQAADRDIMFTFFQGEAFDYIGSSRMLYEMQKGRFPVDFGKGNSSLNVQKIDVSHLRQFVELSQVGMRDDDKSLWLHVDPTVRQKSSQEVQAMLSKLKEFGAESNTTFSENDPLKPLPPASVQRFLMEGEGAALPSVVITDHKAAFTNKYYNSRMDLPAQIEADYPAWMSREDRYDADTVQSGRITALATALAQYLFWAATGQDPTDQQKANLTVDRKDVNHMLYCFLHSPHCELFNFTISPDSAKALNKNKQPFPFYVTISQNTNQVTSLVQRVLAYFTGHKVENATEDSCDVKDSDKRYTYLWMQGDMETEGGKRKAVCYKSGVRLSKAESPAFDIEDYDLKSGRYSTWTESRWDNFKVRVFLIPSKQSETTVLSIGVVLFLLSMLLVYGVSARADVLFARRGTSREYLLDVDT